MLPKDKRVTTEVFAEVLKKGVSLFTPALSLKYIKKTTQSPSRFSVFVPKKVLKKSVDRNKVKRKINAVLVSLYPEIEDSFVGVLFAKHHTQTLPYSLLVTEVRQILKKAGALK